MGNSETKSVSNPEPIGQEPIPQIDNPPKELSINMKPTKSDSSRIRTYRKFPKFVEDNQLMVEPTATPQTASLQVGIKQSDSPQIVNSPQLLSPSSQSGLREFSITYRKTEPEKTDLLPERAQTEGAQIDSVEDTIKVPLKKRKADLLKSKTSEYFSNSNLLDIKAILNAQLLNSRNPTQVLYEGEILKFRPGEGSTWIERWCKITPTAFVFYKGDLNNQCWDVTPTMAIPISDIISVLRVTLDLTTQNSNQHEKKDYLSSRYKYKQVFQFEIFTEEEEYPYKEEIDCDIFNQDEIEKEIKMKKAQKALKNQADVSQIERSKLWDSPKIIEEIPQIPKKNPLDRPLLTYRTYRKTRDSVRNSTRSSNRDILENSSRHLPRLSNSPGSDILKSGKENEADQILSAPKKNLSPIKRRSPKKVPGYKWVRDLGDTHLWSTKEREWYFSEQRMLFGCSNLEEREKWLAILNWITERYTSSA